MISFGIHFVAAQSSSNTSHCLKGETLIIRGLDIDCIPCDISSCPCGTFVGVDNQGRDICKAWVTSTICADPNGIQDNRPEDCVTYSQNEIVFTSEQLENRDKLLEVGTVELEQLENSDKLSGYAADESEQKINPNKVVDTQSGETPDNTTLILVLASFITVMVIIVASILIKKSNNLYAKEKARRLSEISVNSDSELIEENRYKEKSNPNQNRSYVILMDTNVCMKTITECKTSEDTERQNAIKEFFEKDRRFFVIKEVKKELGSNKNKKLIEKKGYDPSWWIDDICSYENTDRTYNVKIFKEGQKRFDRTAWGKKIADYVKGINDDESDNMLQHRKRWRIIKREGIVLKPPYKFDILEDENGKKDLEILSKVAYLAALSEDYKIILLTFDNDFIVFANRIKKCFNVHVLSGWWYFDESNKDVMYPDPIDEMIDMTYEKLDLKYNVLDDKGNAKPRFDSENQ